MVRLLKTFLLLLLISALPVQGMASVIKASCGPSHHNLSSAVMAVEHDHHAHASSHGHDAFDAHTFTEGVDQATGESAPDAGAAQALGASYCSACAACCTGAVAPPASLALTSTFITAEAAVLPPDISFTVFIPAGPDRPPKRLSA